MQEHLCASIKFLNEIPYDKLHIPNYQRPYRWKHKNVFDLLNDINNVASKQNDKLEYRIGSLILHKTDKGLDIVDGQQRITTIALIIKALDCDNEYSELISSFCEQGQFSHIDSHANIKENYRSIKEWINDTLKDESAKTKFLSFLIYQCSFVFIEVGEEYLSEAFQMFDSQNGRGRELEAYNLLKAYHLGVMYTPNINEDTRVECDQHWEAATRYQNQDVLKQVIHEHLYRTRLWARNIQAGSFDKTTLSEFKGFTISQNRVDYPYQNRLLLQMAIPSEIYELTKNRFNDEEVERNSNQFASIIQTIINGKNFFDYVQTYIESYKLLFMGEGNGNGKAKDEDELLNFRTFYKKQCCYNGSGRTGDGYIRDLYKSLILYLFDKYGMSGVNKYHKALYACVYRLRLEKKRVYYQTVAKHPIANYELFAIISDSKHINDMYELEKWARTPVDLESTMNGIEKITDFLINEYNHSFNGKNR